MIIGMDVSVFFEGSFVWMVSGWLFVVIVSIMVLLMILCWGIKVWIFIFRYDVSYLFVFVILDVIFFVFSFVFLEESIGLYWVKSILVGIMIVFVIYSFNEFIIKN